MPKVTRYGSKKLVNLNIADYLIDWSPKREVSKPQAAVKRFLHPYWKTHVVTEEARIPGSLLRVDLISWTSHVAIEVSPKGSHSFNPFFHGTKGAFGAAMKRELGKAEWLAENRFKLVEIFDEDIPVLSRAWFRDKYSIEL
jgi:hypothetical protein